MRLSNSQLELLRTRAQQSKLYLSIFQPVAVFKAQVNNASAAAGDRVITFDNVSLGTFDLVVDGMTMWVGTSPGGMEVGKVRVRSSTSSTITVSENDNIHWQDNLYLTVFRYWELWPIFPRIIQDPNDAENVIFYKDYDIPYTNQNSILGTFVNAGPHRAAFLDPATGQAQIYYSSTGSYNLLGDTLDYRWLFEGATVTGSTAAVPGYVTYNTPGHYVTRLNISGSSGGVDTAYRYVSIYNAANPPISKWQLDGLQGSRDEGGYTASLKVFEIIPIQEHAVVVIFGENWYGDTKQSLGGNFPNASDIFFVGYVDKDTIEYDYEHSEISFDATSLTGIMKKTSGFSVSVKSVTSPTTWYELLDMDSRRAIYHYLRWHTTALRLSDFAFVGDDYKIQYFDSDRGSMFDAIDNYMQNALIGQTVSDRQGKVWLETQAMAYSNPTGSFSPPVMDITNRDWRNKPVLEERLTNEVSYMEYGGVAFSGVVTGTFDAFIGSAPGTAPGFYGSIDNHQGMALAGQVQLNALVGNVFANKNSPYPTIGVDMTINAANLDIAPQETVGLHLLPSDTIRNVAINGLFIPRSVTWRYEPRDFILLPQVDFAQLTAGKIGQTVTIPTVAEVGTGWNPPSFSFPPLPTVFPPTYNEASDGGPAKVLVHDTVAGLILTQTFNQQTPGWYQVNSGLTQARYQNINHIIVCPNGAVYVGHVGDDLQEYWIARAPYAGGTFTMIHDGASINATLGIPNGGQLMTFNCNRLKPEEVVFLLNNSISSTIYPYIGAGSTFVVGANFSMIFNQGSISFGGEPGEWVVTGSENSGGSHAYIVILSADIQSIVDQFRMPDEQFLMHTMVYHKRIGTTGNLVHWLNGADDSLSLSTDNCADFIHNVGDQLSNTLADTSSAIAISSNGQFMMAQWSASRKGKSSDGGYSWSDIGNLPTLVPWAFEYVGSSGLSSQWIAARSYVYYSKDFSLSPWVAKRGNILNIAPLLDIDIVRVVP